MRDHVIWAVTLAAALCAAGAAAAQTTSPDPTRLRLAQAVVEANGGRAQAETMVRSMFRSLDKMSADIAPGVASGLVRALHQDVEEQMFSIIPQLIDISIQAYARELTEQELTDLLAWARSPSGQAVARKGVAIRQDILTAETPLLRTMMPGLLQKSIDRVCQANNCTPQQRELLAKAVTQATTGATG